MSAWSQPSSYLEDLVTNDFYKSAEIQSNFHFSCIRNCKSVKAEAKRNVCLLKLGCILRDESCCQRAETLRINTPCRSTTRSPRPQGSDVTMLHDIVMSLLGSSQWRGCWHLHARRSSSFKGEPLQEREWSTKQMKQASPPLGE